MQPLTLADIEEAISKAVKHGMAGIELDGKQYFSLIGTDEEAYKLCHRIAMLPDGDGNLKRHYLFEIPSTTNPA